LNRRSNYAEDEEVFGDLDVVIRILLYMLRNEYEALGHAAVKTQKVSVDEVLLRGLNILFPLLTIDLLNFDSVCRDYMNLLNMASLYLPDKLQVLPNGFIASIMNSVVFGMDSSLQDVCQVSYEILINIGKYHFVQKKEAGSLRTFMDTMLEKVLGILLFKDYNSDMTFYMVDAMFYMIVLRKVQTVSCGLILGCV
jgi:hypothetical protein